MSEVRDQILNLLVNLEKQGDIKTLYPSNVIPALVAYIAQREARAATAARRKTINEVQELGWEPGGTSMAKLIKIRAWAESELAALNTKPAEQEDVDD